MRVRSEAERSEWQDSGRSLTECFSCQESPVNWPLSL
jgi:hypothetical protein